ncbi:MAG: hypothetical protein H0T42_15760 [Deltaproteobacteria bacterium]|nr:hypothetical protein [Deltaproteobacteria bacterium]
MRTLAGGLLVAAHAAAFIVIAGRCVGTELTVDVTAANASEELAIDGIIPPALSSRATTDLDDGSPPGPGLHRKRWSVSYRGGFERSVGAAQLVGPFQDPAARTCTGRVVVGQRLLDDGHAGPGTLAGELAKVLTTELTGQSVFPAGDFRRIDKLSLRWARVEWHPGERRLVGDAPNGYVRAAFEVVLDRVSVPVLIVLIPSAATTELGFRIAARAELDFDNRVAQWISDKLGGNAFVTRLARSEIDGMLVSALLPPPPFDLPGGQQLRFVFCNEPPEILEGLSGALPFAVELGRVAADPAVLPPRRGPSPRLPLAPGHALGIDLDLDALNALLYELWRVGYLDRELAAAGLDRRFNTDPIVTEFLTLRISPLRLALPPVLAPSANGLRLSAEGRVTIADGPATTTGRVWGGLDFRFARTPGQVDVDLGVLELSCEARTTRLVPCYADLITAIRGRSADFHGALTATFATILSEIFVERRLGASGLPADLVIRSAFPSLTVSSTNASLHFDLDATLVP